MSWVTLAGFFERTETHQETRIRRIILLSVFPEIVSGEWFFISAKVFFHVTY